MAKHDKAHHLDEFSQGDREIVEVLEQLDVFPPVGQVQRIMDAITAPEEEAFAPALHMVLRWSLPCYGVICGVMWAYLFYQESQALGLQIAQLSGLAG